MIFNCMHSKFLYSHTRLLFRQCLLGSVALAFSAGTFSAPPEVIERPKTALANYALASGSTEKVLCTKSFEYATYYNYQPKDGANPVELVQLLEPGMMVEKYASTIHGYTHTINTYKNKDTNKEITVLSAVTTGAPAVSYMAKDNERREHETQAVVDAYVKAAKGESYFLRKPENKRFTYESENTLFTAKILDTDLTTLSFTEIKDILKDINNIKAQERDYPKNFEENDNHVLKLGYKERWEPIIAEAIKKETHIIAIQKSNPEDIKAINDILQDANMDPELLGLYYGNELAENYDSFQAIVKQSTHKGYISDAFFALQKHIKNDELGSCSLFQPDNPTQQTEGYAPTVPVTVNPNRLTPLAVQCPQTKLNLLSSLAPAPTDTNKHLNNVKSLTDEVINRTGNPVINVCYTLKSDNPDAWKEIGERVTADKNICLHYPSFIRVLSTEPYSADALTEIKEIQERVQKEINAKN